MELIAELGCDNVLYHTLHPMPNPMKGEVAFSCQLAQKCNNGPDGRLEYNKRFFFMTLSSRLLCTVFTSFMISACQAETQSDDAGRFPTNYKELVENQLRVSLKDLDSVKNLTIPVPHPTQMWRGLIYGGGYTRLTNNRRGTGANTQLTNCL